MHHTHIDSFAGIASPVHRLDPRVKIILAFTYILLVVLTPDTWLVSFLVYAAAVGTAITLSRVPFHYIIARSLLMLPFALVVSVFVPFITPGEPVWQISVGSLPLTMTIEGLVRFSAIGARAFLCFFATITLVATTRFGDLMRAAGALGMPRRLVVLLSFMYRYLFILIDEAMHMLLARDLRGGRGKRRLLAASGGIVGALLVRSFEHAELLYSAMLLRGFAGRPVSLGVMRIRPGDIVAAVVFTTFIAGGFAGGRWLNG